MAPSPHAAAALELAVVMVSLACGAAGAVAAIRARAVVRALRRAVHADRAYGAAHAGAARRLAGAARHSVTAVREEIAHAVRAPAPAIDGVLLYEEHDGELLCVAAFGARFAYYTGSRAALDDTSSLAARAFAARHHVVAHGAQRQPAAVRSGNACAFAVPLALDAGRGCVLVVTSHSALDAEAVGRLVALAEHASFAYLIALERENDRRDAEYDGLTGLLTPRAFRRRLAALAERTRFVPSARLALVFADTDRFKCWNDRYGHAAGDALLRELARVLRAAAAADDLVARNGGDEFCIVFAGVDKAAAIERAEQLRQRVAAIDFSALRPTAAQSEIRISASIGVAALPADASTASDLLERADAAMYHSKETGRNGVSYVGADGAFVRMPPPRM